MYRMKPVARKPTENYLNERIEQQKLDFFKFEKTYIRFIIIIIIIITTVIIINIVIIIEIVTSIRVYNYV